MARTGIRHAGEYPIYAFKRSVATNAFIGVDELFRLYGRQGGYSRVTRNFLEWVYVTHIQNKYNFIMEIDQSEFDEQGNYLFDIAPVEVTGKKSKDRVPKSSQILAKASKDKASADKLNVVSSKLEISDSLKSAENLLVENAKAKRKQRGTIIENIPDKPMVLDTSHVIRGDDFKRKSSDKSVAVVLDGGNPVGVESVNENFKFASASQSERVFVAQPSPSDIDLKSNPVVNYGGKSSRPIKESTEESKPIIGEKISGDNIMSQPAMAALSDLRQPVTIDQIVRNESDASALEAIERCKDTQVLRIASKQLRSLGNKPKVEAAVKRRLSLLPAGSMK